MSGMTGHQHTDDAGGSQRKLTYADFRRFPNDGQRHELIDGKHTVTPAPTWRHQRLLVRLTLALGNFVEANPVAEVLCAPFDCVFGFFDVVEPDVLVVTNDQRHILTKRNARGAPALVIEIISESSSARDERTKRDLYERVGVREYWIVDPDHDSITVHRFDKPRQLPSSETLTATKAGPLQTQLLPGFALDLRWLFR
jgi:Uma2 family endonuclease